MVSDTFTSSRLAKKGKPGVRIANAGRKKNVTKISELSDIEATLRRLEVSDGPTSSCSCNGRKHPLNTVTPNCLNCGKIICTKNSSTVCSSCGEKLLSSEELEAIRAVLEIEKSDLASKASKGKKGKKDTTEALDEANSRLNRLLGYQESSAVRTHIIDQASDFDLPGSGPNKWATATEQAEQLKRQQRMLKQQKKRNDKALGRGSSVMSIDLKGKKVVMNTTKDYDYSSSEEEEESLPITPSSSAPAGSKAKEPFKEKQLIAPQYNKSITAKEKIMDEPSRLQEHDEDAYLEL